MKYIRVLPKAIAKFFRIILKNFFTYFLVRFRKDLITGLIFLLPLGGTVFLVWKTFEILTELIEDMYQQVIPWWLGFVFTILIIYFVGLLVRSVAVNRFLNLAENILIKLPLVRNLYTTFKQLVELFFKGGKMYFHQAVICEYPRKGIWSIGFITDTAPLEIKEKTGEHDLVSIFIATTPNPTSGLLVMLPKKDVIPLDMNVEEAIKLIISGGILKPKEELLKLAEKVEKS